MVEIEPILEAEDQAIEQSPQDLEGKVVVFEHLEYRESEAIERRGARRSVALTQVKDGHLGPHVLIDIQLGANPDIDRESLKKAKKVMGKELIAVDFNGYRFFDLSPDYEEVVPDPEDLDELEVMRDEYIEVEKAEVNKDWTQYRPLSHSSGQIKEILSDNGFTIDDYDLEADMAPPTFRL